MCSEKKFILLISIGLLLSCKQIKKNSKGSSDLAAQQAGEQKVKVTISVYSHKADRFTLDSKEQVLSLNKSEKRFSLFSEAITDAEVQKILIDNNIIEVSSDELMIRNKLTGKVLDGACYRYALDLTFGVLLVDLSEHSPLGYAEQWDKSILDAKKFLPAISIGNWVILAAGDLCVDEVGKLVYFNNKGYTTKNLDEGDEDQEAQRSAGSIAAIASFLNYLQGFGLYFKEDTTNSLELGLVRLPPLPERTAQIPSPLPGPRGRGGLLSPLPPPKVPDLLYPNVTEANRRSLLPIKDPPLGRLSPMSDEGPSPRQRAPFSPGKLSDSSSRSPLPSVTDGTLTPLTDSTRGLSSPSVGNRSLGSALDYLDSLPPLRRGVLSPIGGVTTPILGGKDPFAPLKPLPSPATLPDGANPRLSREPVQPMRLPDGANRLIGEIREPIRGQGAEDPSVSSVTRRLREARIMAEVVNNQIVARNLLSTEGVKLEMEHVRENVSTSRLSYINIKAQESDSAPGPFITAHVLPVKTRDDGLWVIYKKTVIEQLQAKLSEKSIDTQKELKTLEVSLDYVRTKIIQPYFDTTTSNMLGFHIIYFKGAVLLAIDTPPKIKTENSPEQKILQGILDKNLMEQAYIGVTKEVRLSKSVQRLPTLRTSSELQIYDVTDPRYLARQTPPW